MERILRGMDASLTAMYIMTATNMSKRVYLEDVIERCVQFTKFQLSNTIYPSFDPVYRIDSKKGQSICKEVIPIFCNLCQKSRTPQTDMKRAVPCRGRRIH